ncbi:aminotransferase class V-fold PLP-dependent enzyme [Candidatus Nasuia deltocephalinicola]|uniref:aminotransferase class V-fold PLP-dependent enzyme n=1 Tax=Candidatus Nasuia deltocephalincola TaxID=1160784 RepID=UPI00216AB621|nr:aminotransferase class V-fold PLP-dependent enzyme [Candidatus Nasuia deltocephalinicola]
MFFFYILFPIYIDYSSTTPLDPRVLEKIIPYFYYKFGNYSSKNHVFGWSSYNIVENCRKNISKFLNCDSREIIWCSGSTESNNLSLKGYSLFYKNKSKSILSIKTEHKSILNSLNYLLIEGFNIIYLKLKNNGLLNLNHLNIFLNKKIILLTISYINNEIGVFQNILFLSRFCKLNKIALHVDCSQAVGKILFNLENIKIDLASISSHKLYGPKGVSILYIRRKSNIYFKPIFHGGGQENNLRPGTVPTSLIVGFFECVNLIKKIIFFENLKIRNLRNIFLIELLKIDSLYINGDIKYRVPQNLNISFNFIEGESLIISINNIALSTGSACASNSLESSHVLKFLKNSKFINSSIRFTFGRFNKLTDIYFSLKLLFFNIYKLRKLSPFLII